MNLTGFLFRNICFIVVLFAILTGCSDDNPTAPLNLDGRWQPAELADRQVEVVEAGDGLVLAGTDWGVYRRSLARPSADWIHSGLNIDSARVVDVVIRSRDVLMAAVLYENRHDRDKPMLYKSIDGGDTWDAVQVNKPPEMDYFVIHDLEKQPGSSQGLFAYVGRVLHSPDGGNNWNIIHSGSFSEFLNVSEFHPDQIWTGGVTTIFSPYLAKSTDGGQNWTRLDKQFFFGSDATVYDALLSPVDENDVLAGVGGAVDPANVIRRSTDNGQTWQTVNQGINTRTLTHDVRNPVHIYASGRNASGTLFFVASPDFGGIWETVEKSDSPANITVRDIKSVEEGGQRVLYLATNKGIHSYRFAE